MYIQTPEKHFSLFRHSSASAGGGQDNSILFLVLSNSNRLARDMWNFWFGTSPFVGSGAGAPAVTIRLKTHFPSRLALLRMCLQGTDCTLFSCHVKTNSADPIPGFMDGRVARLHIHGIGQHPFYLGVCVTSFFFCLGRSIEMFEQKY